MEYSHIGITTGVRPPKVAVLVLNNHKYWISSCKAIISTLNNIWGGEYNLIIPTDGNTIKEPFKTILEVYDPDYFVRYSDNLKQIVDFDVEHVDEFFDKYFILNGLTKEEAYKKKITYENPLNWTPSNSLFDEINSFFNPFFRSTHQHLNIFTYGKIPGFPYTNVLNLLSCYDNKNINIINYKVKCSITELLLISLLGYFNPDEKQKNMDIYSKSPYEIDSESEFFKYDISDAISRENSKHKAFEISLLGTTYYTKNMQYSDETDYFIIIGDTLEDFCFYYSLSKVLNNVYWIPQTSEYKTDIVESIRGEIEKNYNINKAKIHLLSNSIKSINEEFYSDGSHNMPSIDKEFTFNNFSTIKDAFKNGIRILLNTDNFFNKSYTLLKEGKSIWPIDTPTPKGFSCIKPTEFYWITDVEIDSFLYPQNRDLATEILKHKNYSSNEIRITNNGLSYFSPYNSYFYGWGNNVDYYKANPDLSLLHSFNLFEKMFSIAGFSIKQSDKGYYQDYFISIVNGLENMASFFLDTHKRNILYKFNEIDKPGKGNYENGVVINKRRYLDFNSISCFLDIKSEQVQLILNEFLDLHIFHRGFIFKCKKCRNADWYSINEVSDSFLCKRCSSHQKVTSENLFLQPPNSRVEPVWYYKLDEILFQAIEHDTETTTLTLRAFKKSARKAFDFCSEVEVRKDANSNKPDMEIDICCTVDGRFIIGECKSNGLLGRNKDEIKKCVKKYLKLANSVNVHFIIFSTLSSWNATHKEIFEEYRKRQNRVEIIEFDSKVLYGIEEINYLFR